MCVCVCVKDTSPLYSVTPTLKHSEKGNSENISGREVHNLCTWEARLDHKSDRPF